MKKLSIVILSLAVAVCASAKDDKTSVKSAEDSLAYAAGMTGSNGLEKFLDQQFGITKEELPQFVEAFREYLKNKADKKTNIVLAGGSIAQQISKGMIPSMRKQYGEKLDENLMYEGFIAGLMNDTTNMTLTDAQSKLKAKAEADKKVREAEKAAKAAIAKAEGEKFLKDNAKKKGVKTLPSGLQYKVLKEGTGAIPTKDQTVTVKYEGHLIDGTVFDSSYKRNPQTTDFKPSQVIKGWTEALTMMPVGSEWELYIPENLAYGDRAQGKIPSNSTLIFKVELVSIKDK